MSTKIQEAINLYKNKNFDSAEKILIQIISLEPNNLAALNLLGLINVALSRYEHAANFFKKIVMFKTDDAIIYYNLAKSLHKTKNFSNYKEALKYYNFAIQIKQNFVDALINKSQLLYDLKDYELSLKCAEDVIGLNPDPLNLSKTILNKSLNLLALCRHDEAFKFCNQAIQINPNSESNWICKGNILGILKKYEQALECYNKAININSNSFEAYLSRGRFFLERRKFVSALHDFDKAYFLDQNYDFLLGNIYSVFLNLFEFKKNKLIMKEILVKIKNNLIPIDSFSLLSFNDDAYVQLNLLKNIINKHYPASQEDRKINFNNKKKNKKIKLAYFSSDFGEHPVGRQVVELFELHDKEIFEIYLISLKNHAKCLLNARIINSQKHFIDVENKTISEIVVLIRNLNVDIAVDLNGFTAHNKIEVFYSKVAPIQINFLGYPGTISRDFFDYIIADKIVIPSDSKEKYTEKIIYLPNSYQPNDRQKQISKKKLVRSDFGLKDNEFVFCCFSQTHKITEEIFNTWVKILKKVPNSVLWLLKPHHQITKKNIIKEIDKNKISSKRIIFLKPQKNPIFLSLHSLADLYLDTFPYNAHSTASDSLLSGLPLLTLMGKSFHSRVAGSILNAINLSELITVSFNDYEKLAVELALNRQKLQTIKNKLISNIKNAPLFDTPLYTKNLESAYKKIYERYQLDQKPDHIYI
jgi:predicted O-linked N-acetylglucosamine transferase (SPINDLY family)